MMRRSLVWLVNFMPVYMPALSPSMDTGAVVEWKKKVGDAIKENDVFCTIQTDKAVVDYTNTFEEGILAKIFCQNGQSAPVSKVIAVMVEDAADVQKADEFVPEGEESAAPAAEAGSEKPAAEQPKPAAAPASTSSAPAGKLYGGTVESAIAASGPGVARIAARLPGDVLKGIQPTGKDGRFRKADFVGQPGFDYEAQSPAAAKGAANKTTAAGSTPAASGASGDIYNVVLKATPAFKKVDDSPVLKRLISTMSLPSPKLAKKASMK